MQNDILIERYYQELWNSWDFSLAEQLLHPDLVFRGSMAKTSRGLPGFIDYMHQVKAGFGDFHNNIDEVVTSGTRSAVRLTFSGTHTGEVLGHGPTYKKIAYAGMALFTIEQGVATHIWVLGDLHGLLGQFIQNDGRRP